MLGVLQMEGCDQAKILRIEEIFFGAIIETTESYYRTSLCCPQVYLFCGGSEFTGLRLEELGKAR